MIETISVEEFVNLMKNQKDGLEIIDVREENEYNEIHIENSKLIPMGELINKLDEVDWNKNVIFVCRSGARSLAMTEEVSELGKRVKNLELGILGLMKKGKEFLIEG